MNKNVKALRDRAEAGFPVPNHVRNFVGQPPLRRGEDERRYWRLFSGLFCTIDAQDHYEWMLVKEMTDQIWELQRLSGIKAALLDAAEFDALLEVLQKVHSDKNIEKITEMCCDWFGNPDSRQNLLDDIAKFGFSAATLDALAFKLTLQDMETIGRMVGQAMFLRVAALKEVEIHRQRKQKLSANPKRIKSDHTGRELTRSLESGEA